MHIVDYFRELFLVIFHLGLHQTFRERGNRALVTVL